MPVIHTAIGEDAELECELSPYNHGKVSFDDQIRAATDRALTDLRGHLEADLLRYSGEVTRMAAELRAAETPARGAHSLRLEELVQAIRALDAARSLADVLAQLMHFAAGEVDRAAILIVRGGRLHEWRSTGFSTSFSAEGLTFEEAGLAGAVARSGLPASRPPGPASDNRHTASTIFGSAGEPRHAVAVPIAVSGTVVGVLYADAPIGGSAPDFAWWPAILEVVARHASRILEVITIQHVTGFSARESMAQPSHPLLSAEVSPRSLQ